MVINENNSHINSFTKGMNSDTAYDQIQNVQYTYGKNIRITKNQMLGGASDYSTIREGVVSPVPIGRDAEPFVFKTNEIGQYPEIIATDSIDDISIVICSDDTDDIAVFKIDPDSPSNPELIWFSEQFFNGKSKDISTVLYKELDNVIKLYIASDVCPIITLRVEDGHPNYYSPQTHWRDKDYLINNRIMPKDPVYIDDVIDGRLITSQVQYTYRFYNKYGNSTQLAPLTNKIQVISPIRDKEVGNAENTETSIGFTIKIPIKDSNNFDYMEDFDRMQVFRLSFIKPNEDSEVALIYDDKIKKVSGNNFILNDVGIEPLQVLTIEEFSSMSGLILTPRTIETNQQYMFCSNVEDDTIITDLRLNGVDGNTTIPIVHTSVTISDTIDGTIPTVTGEKFKSSDYIYENNDSPLMSVTDYFENRGINSNLPKSTYNNLFASSLLRSLRRGEEYKYGIVYYDDKGRRSDVIPIGNVKVGKIGVDINPFTIEGGKLIANPIGVKITLPQPKNKYGNIYPNIVGCQIVRRSSSEIYQNTLLQVALARPIQQNLALLNKDWETENKSPFYPSGFLSTDDIYICPTYYEELTKYADGYSTVAGSSDLEIENGVALNLGNNIYVIRYSQEVLKYFYKFSAKTKNKQLFQIFSSEIDFRRDDVLDRLNVSDVEIENLLSVQPSYKRYGDLSVPTWQTSSETLRRRHDWEEGLRFFGELDVTNEYIIDPNNEDGITKSDVIFHRDQTYKLSTTEKTNVHWVFNYFTAARAIINPKPSDKVSIKSIKDVKIPGWNDGFTNILKNDDGLTIGGIKKYQQYTTSIDHHVYNNWASFGKYNFQTGGMERFPNTTAHKDGGEFIDKSEWLYSWINDWNDSRDDFLRCGFIGPGPSCFLIATKGDFGTYYDNNKLHTLICNITHSPKIENVQSEEHTTYFGFGNYFRLKLDNNQYKIVNKNNSLSTYAVVFDGDIYITPHEITTMYKTYNFESVDTLQSTQITNYIPLESKVNTYFDYGQNLRNTESPNLIYEPGQIEGIITQERPAHQYNMIYSDNDASNDVFTLISTDKNETNKFPQRTYFSEPKTNGEFIDNFLIFKPASFIDVEGTYGQITELATNKNILYYWQEHAFGKFSVNERSLVNDTNGNTIMLGQAGILSRYDYIDTRYGMRECDRCECPVDDMVYWVDINNKAVVAGNTQQAINYGERLGVQNIINDTISTKKPYVHHDLQNDELLCKCLRDGYQLVFNTKYNMATSIYTRRYDDMLNVKNHLYTAYITDNDDLQVNKINYLTNVENVQFLSPIQLKFVVNPNASITKVFDSQQVVPIKRNISKESFDNTQMYFETDTFSKVIGDMQDRYTDREGNIIYNVPRWGNEQYGNRMRGKWMLVDMYNNDPTEYSCLSHVITKFRQSFS